MILGKTKCKAADKALRQYFLKELIATVADAKNPAIICEIRQEGNYQKNTVYRSPVHQAIQLIMIEIM